MCICMRRYLLAIRSYENKTERVSPPSRCHTPAIPVDRNAYVSNSHWRVCGSALLFSQIGMPFAY